MVSTHLKSISQIGPFPQIGMKIKNIWNHHLDKNRGNKYHLQVNLTFMGPSLGGFKTTQDYVVSIVSLGMLAHRTSDDEQGVDSITEMKCVSGIFTKHFEPYKAILGMGFPWLISRIHTAYIGFRIPNHFRYQRNAWWYLSSMKPFSGSVITESL